MRYIIYMGIRGHEHPDSWINTYEIKAKDIAEAKLAAQKLKLSFYVGMCNVGRMKPYHTIYFDMLHKNHEGPSYTEMEIALRRYINNEVIYEIAPAE